MKALETLIAALGGKTNRFGVLAKSDTSQLTVIAKNSDVAVGDMFLLPCERGVDGELGEKSGGGAKHLQRFFVFRATEYSNIMSRTLEMNDVARHKLTMDDSYFSRELVDETLLELRGMVIGYAQFDETEKRWRFFRPRRLPSHLTEVYKVEKAHAPVIRELLADQLEKDGIRIGNLLVGEKPMGPIRIGGKMDPGVEARMPIHAVATHLGIFGRTGTGKSNLMMVLVESFLRYNERLHTSGKKGQPRVSLFAIDPHDEFCRWHESQTKLPKHGGVRQIVESYKKSKDKTLIPALVAPFYYLTARPLGKEEKKDPLMKRLRFSYADITPGDLFSVLDFSEQQSMFAHAYYGRKGQDWIYELLNFDTAKIQDNLKGTKFLDGTIEAVQRRLAFLTSAESAFDKFHSDKSIGCDKYTSLLPDIVCALETGRVLVVDSSHLGELEQFLVTTIVARLLFNLRRALRSAESGAMLEDAIRQALDNAKQPSKKIGLRKLADELVARLTKGDFKLPYLNPKAENGKRNLDELPLVSVVVEEAPSVLNPARMKFGSVFRDISRQGRKFRVGLTVVSQQVTEIDEGILSQINTQLILALGSDAERREAIKIASADLSGFQRELQVMDTGQLIFSASYKQLPLPVKVPNFDTL